MTTSLPKEYYSWSRFLEDRLTLLKQITDSLKRYDSIYAIPRGGLVLGTILSYALDIPILLGGAGSNTLCLDDIADTGRTLSPFVDRCDTLTIFRKRSCPFTPTYWLHETENWIVFPWE